LNYSRNRIPRPTPSPDTDAKNPQAGFVLHTRFPPNPALAVEIGGFAETGRFVNLSKSCHPHAKPTRPSVLLMHVGKALAMAPDMLLLGADEVARNGAFRRILRPEVFPDAPLHLLRLSLRWTPSSFPALPRESSWK